MAIVEKNEKQREAVKNESWSFSILLFLVSIPEEISNRLEWDRVSDQSVSLWIGRTTNAREKGYLKFANLENSWRGIMWHHGPFASSLWNNFEFKTPRWLIASTSPLRSRDLAPMFCISGIVWRGFTHEITLGIQWLGGVAGRTGVCVTGHLVFHLRRPRQVSSSESISMACVQGILFNMLSTLLSLPR